MDKTKAITIISVAIVFVAGVVCIVALFLYRDNDQTSIPLENKAVSSISDFSNESLPASVANKDSYASLSLTKQVADDKILSATCEVGEGSICDLYGSTSGQSAVLFLKSESATQEFIGETKKVQYTWDLTNNVTLNNFSILVGKSVDRSGNISTTNEAMLN